MNTIQPPATEGSAPDATPAPAGASPRPSIEIRLLSTAGEMAMAVDVLKQVWGSPTEIVPLEMLMAISHSGGYVAAVFDTGDGGQSILGASVGILARHGGGPALHSHVTGILPGVRHTGLGRSIKLHQRAWAAEQGIESIVWTFDPLVRRNAWFNIAVLGVDVQGYLENFYGEMTDAINAGDVSDRLLVGWRVDAPVPEGVRDGDGLTGVDLVPTPADIVALRRTDPVAVARWRSESRRALAGALAAGRPIVGFTRAGEYVIGQT